MKKCIPHILTTISPRWVIMCLGLLLLGDMHITAQSIKVLPGNGSTSNKVGPQSAQRYQRVFYLIKSSEIAASGLSDGSLLNSIGFTLAKFRKDTNHAAFKVFLENTMDTESRYDSSWTSMVLSGNSLKLDPLFPGAYEWQVSTNCSDASSFSPSSFFRTNNLGDCIAPTSLKSTSITSSAATLSWMGATSPGTVRYVVAYKEASSSLWLLDSTTSLSLNVTGLIADKQYQWKVFTRCTTDSSDAPGANFQTLPASNCNLPTAPMIVSSVDSSAIVKWTLAAGATYSSLRWRRVNSLDWITASTFSDQDSLTGLVPGTKYEWQVRTNCAAGVSDYVAGPTVTTTGTTVCYPPDQLFADSLSSQAVNLSWAGAEDATGYTLRYRLKDVVKWSTATDPMTLVHNDSIVMPDTLGLFTIPFVNGDPFTYTGNGMYVAFEFERSEGDLQQPDLYLSTFGEIAIKDTSGYDSARLFLSFVSRGDTSIIEQDSILNTVNSRPETFFGSPSLMDSLNIESIYALGNITPDKENKVTAVIKSYMASDASVNVELKVVDKATNAVKYSSAMMANMQAGDTSIVSFTLPHQPIGEMDSIVISVPAQGDENVLTNNSNSYFQTFTNGILGYDDGSASIAAAGMDTLAGLTLVKLSLSDCKEVIGVKAFLSEETSSHELYAVLLDNTGTILAQSSPFTPGQDDINNYHSFYFATPVAVSLDSFYAGIGQAETVDGLAPVGVQWEGTLIRSGAYFRAKPNGDSLTEQKLPGRLMINVEMSKSGDYVTIDGNDVLCAGAGSATLTAAKMNARYADAVVDFSSQNSAPKYGANQALGAPDVYPAYGVSDKAWVPGEAGNKQFITLHFPGAAPINYVDIYETLNPGAVTTVLVKNPGTNNYDTVYSGITSAKAPKSVINRIKLLATTAYDVDQVKIYIDSVIDRKGAYSAIDAVSIGIITTPGNFDSYSWSPGGETSQAINITTAGTYVLSTTTSGGCDGIDSIVVTTPSFTTPVITALGATTFCDGDSVILTSDQDYGNTWNTGETSKTIVVKTAGDYTVTFDDGLGCGGVSSNTISVTTKSIPTISITGSTEVCAGSSITLSASGASGLYFWSTGSASSTATINGPGQYWVKGADNGCYGYDTVDITTAADITPAIIGGTSFCPGGSTVLDAGAGYNSYQWSTGETSQTINAAIVGPYSVTVQNASGCKGTASVTTSAYASPTAAISGNLDFCPGGSTTLDAGPGFSTYQWSNATSAQTVIISATGTYKVIVSNSDGCIDSTEVSVGQFSAPTPVIVGNLGICPAGTTSLSTKFAYDSYSWSTGATTQSINVNSIASFMVTVSDENGCTGQASATTFTRSLPSPAISGTLSFCAGNSTTLDAGLGYASYAWSTGATGHSITVTEVDTYEVTVTDAYGCSAMASATTTTDDALPVPPGPITGPTLGVCGGTNQLYSISPVPNSNFYVWMLPDGASFADNDTSSTSVKINYAPGFSGGQLIVAANNVCGQSASIIPTYLNVGSKAATPASISGATNGICGPITKSYSVVPVPGASYTWTAPANASITSGQGTANVSIAYTAAFTGGAVCVKAITSCGSSPNTCLNVYKTLDTLGVISGLASVCNKQKGVTYSVPALPGATSYNWVVESSATIVAGLGTNSIKVDWNNKGGTVSVQAISACGVTAFKTIKVNMDCGGALMTQFTAPAPQQEIRLEPEVIANDGGEAMAGDINLSWTLGEAMVETLSGNGNRHMVTQGFHQPHIMILKTPKDSVKNDKGLRIVAAPNPVTSILKVHFFADEEQALMVQLTNVLGNMKLNIPVRISTTTLEIKMASYPQGVYFLTVQDRTGKTIKVIKVLKL